MEKTLRVLSSEGGGHSHSHSHSVEASGPAGNSSGVEVTHKNGEFELKTRKEKKEDKKDQKQAEERSSQDGPSKLSAYLNLFGDFVHNMYVPHFPVASFHLAHSNVSVPMDLRKSVLSRRFGA